MRRSSLFLPATALLFLFAGCSDSTTGLKPTLAAGPRSNVITPSGTLDQNVTAILALLPKGLETAATTRWGNIKSKYVAGQTDPSQLAVAKQMLFELSDWVKQKAPNMDTPPNTETKPAAAARAVLYMSLYIYNGPTTPAPSYTPSADAVIGFVTPGAAATIVTPTTHAGVQLEAGSVDENTIVVVTQNPTPFPANCSGPLTTRLCQYPQFYTFEQFPHKRLLKGAKFSVCHINGGNDRRPLADHDRFRLAHAKPADPADYTPGSTVRDGPGESIEILPLTTQTFTNCTDTEYAPEAPIGVIGALSRVGRALASVLSPKPVYAIDQGGGGVSRFFSPFNDVDPLGSPDLSVDSLGVGNAVVHPGDHLSVGLVVSNKGAATGSPVGGVIYLTPPPPIEGPPQPDQQIGSILLPSLVPQAADTLNNIDVTVPSDLASGAYQIKVVVGTDPVLSDVNPANNTAIRSMSVDANIIDLGVLPGDDASVGMAINDAGHAVGVSEVNLAARPFLWVNGAMTSLGSLGGTIGWAQGINNNDEVVGYSQLATGEYRAFRWKDGTMTNLGTLPGTVSSIAVGINSVGQVAGYSLGNNDFQNARPWIWQNGVMTELTLPEGFRLGLATAINDGGAIVGWATSTSESQALRPWIWRNGQMSLVTDHDGQALGLNDNGVVVGLFAVSADITRAFVEADGFTDLGVLAGDVNSMAEGVSSDGTIVGLSYQAAGFHAVMWQNGQIVSLGTLGGTFGEAIGINESGQIVGQSTTASNKGRATIWKIPPPPVIR